MELKERPANKAFVALQAIDYMLKRLETVSQEIGFLKVLAKDKVVGDSNTEAIVDTLRTHEDFIREFGKKLHVLAEEIGDYMDGGDMIGHVPEDVIVWAMFDVLNDRVKE